MKKIEVYKSKRKTISIWVKDESTVILRVPDYLQDKEINSLLDKHKNWIDKKLALNSLKKKIDLKPNGQTLYFGKYYDILVTKTKTAKNPSFADDNFYIKENTADIKKAFAGFYKEELRKYASERIKFFAKIMNIQYNILKISSAKTRWGSCSSNKNISLSNRLCCVEKELIDFILVHELCHIREMNHSDKFYELLRTYMPDYKEKENRLRAYENIYFV